MRFAISFCAIASKATGYDVFPICLPTPISRRDMIHVQFLWQEFPSAILATKLVTLEKILAIEFHFLNRQAVIETEQEYLRHKNLLAHGMDETFGSGSSAPTRKLKPTFGVIYTKVIILGMNDLGMILG
tara:strand:- start:1913 stop:2299 length:387 start_codon:yes stop_codon:yes gene_type:complete